MSVYFLFPRHLMTAKLSGNIFTLHNPKQRVIFVTKHSHILYKFVLEY